MPWYHIYASHGPGHQSYTDKYRYFEKPLSKEEKKNVFENDMGGYYDPIGKVIEIKALPEHIHELKVIGAMNTITHNQKLLKVLETTPQLPVIAVRFESKGVFRARLLMKEEVSATGPTRDKAVKALFKILKQWWKGTPVTKNHFAVIVR